MCALQGIGAKFIARNMSFGKLAKINQKISKKGLTKSDNKHIIVKHSRERTDIAGWSNW